MTKYALIAVLAFSTVACSRDRPLGDAERNRAADARDTAVNAPVNTDRRDFENRTEARIERIERDIERWKERKADAKTNQAKRAAGKRVEELERLKDESKDKYNEMKRGADSNWEQFKDGVSRSVDNLEKQWDEFTADVKN